MTWFHIFNIKKISYQMKKNFSNLFEYGIEWVIEEYKGEIVRLREI